MDNCPADEQKRLFTLEEEQYKMDSFLSYPAGGGESIPALCLRLKTDWIAHLARECSDKIVIATLHGHVMRGLQMIFEDLGHDDFIRLDSSKEPADKILNCQILWYTRRDPDTGKVESNRLVAARSVCPSGPLKADYGWRRIERHTYTNQDLLNEVNRYPREIKK